MCSAYLPGFIHPPGEEYIVKVCERQVPHAEDEHSENCQLVTHAPLSVVQLRLETHARIHNQKETRVQRANVVQNVGVPEGETEKDDEKVEAPHHLHQANRPEVALHVEKGKVSKSRHPDIARNHHTNCVVRVFGMEIMIPEDPKPKSRRSNSYHVHGLREQRAIDSKDDG